MLLTETIEKLSRENGEGNLLNFFSEEVSALSSSGFIPLRFAIPKSKNDRYDCEIGGLWSDEESAQNIDSIFRFNRRKTEQTERFTTALMVPTGVGAEVGGHAGDAGPVARLMGQVSDEVILHPNVVNASDINELPENSLYVEGSVLCRLLMGTVGLERVRKNRVLVVIDNHQDSMFINLAVNAINGARASYGLDCPAVVTLNPPVRMKSRFSDSGRAAGRVEQLDGLCRLLDEKKGAYDAVALSSVIDVPEEYHQGYFDAEGEMVNPWGGVEAMLTHAVSSLYNVPSAHAPMFESREVANMDPGMVDSRMAAEAVSTNFLQCVLKGLQRSPRIVTDTETMARPGVVTAENVSCLVMPDGALGLPTLAALEQGITVIAVKENSNILENDLTSLPWKPGQFHVVENYWEAAGLIASLRAGIAPESVRRPLPDVRVEKADVQQTASQSKKQDESLFGIPVESYQSPDK